MVVPIATTHARHVGRFRRSVAEHPVSCHGTCETFASRRPGTAARSATGGSSRCVCRLPNTRQRTARSAAGQTTYTIGSMRSVLCNTVFPHASPEQEIQVEPGPQDGTLLVTWTPVIRPPSSGPVTGYAVYADGKKVRPVRLQLRAHVHDTCSIVHR